MRAMLFQIQSFAQYILFFLGLSCLFEQEYNYHPKREKKTDFFFFSLD